MKRQGLIRYGLIGAGALALIGIAWYGYAEFYAKPTAALREAMKRSKDQIANYERELNEEFEVRKLLREFGHSTLGASAEIGVHRFRTMLTRVAEAGGLGNVVVDQGPPRRELNPAISRFPARQRETLRRQTDFEIVRGSVKGQGTLGQALGTLALLQSQPWVQRIEGFVMRPVARERGKVEFRVDVASILAPDLRPKDDPELAIAGVGSEREEAARRIAARNVFVEPAPEAPPTRVAKADPPKPAPPQPDPLPAPPPPPPWDDWRVTGIVTSSRGVEVTLINQRTQERRIMLPGETLLSATLVNAAGERAVFRIEQDHVEVMVGQTLGARRPVG